MTQIYGITLPTNTVTETIAQGVRLPKTVWEHNDPSLRIWLKVAYVVGATVVSIFAHLALAFTSLYYLVTCQLKGRVRPGANSFPQVPVRPAAQNNTPDAAPF